MAVCRGKLSEGVDFSGQDARSVVIVGVPFLDMSEPSVVIKRHHLDSLHSKELSPINGGDWYTGDAMRAVNQAIGRTIRHKNDYGAAIIIDTRLSNEKY